MADERSRQDISPVLKRDHLSALSKIQQLLGPSERELLLSEEELDRSLIQTMKEAPPGGDIWVFGYGSLIWNPVFPVAAARTAMIYGYHRSLCMNSKLVRGSIHNPGVMLALDVGGACKGLVMKVGGDVPVELELLWRREMLSGAYKPRWLNAKAEGISVRALSFVADPASSHYAGRLSDDEIVRRLATASGIWGSNLDYVERTLESLQARGIHDAALARVLKLHSTRRELARVPPSQPHSETE